MSPFRRRGWLARVSRDTVLFTAGLIGFTHEVVFGSSTERPTLLLICAALMGLPVFLRTDEKRQEDEEKEGSP
jgi:hypothetical protein